MNILVGHRCFIKTSANQFNPRLLQKFIYVSRKNGLFRFCARHCSAGAMRSRVYRRWSSFATNNKSWSGHRALDNSEHTFACRSGALAMHNDFITGYIFFFLCKVVMVLYHCEWCFAKTNSHPLMNLMVTRRCVITCKIHSKPVLGRFRLDSCFFCWWFKTCIHWCMKRTQHSLTSHRMKAHSDGINYLNTAGRESISCCFGFCFVLLPGAHSFFFFDSAFC